MTFVGKVLVVVNVVLTVCIAVFAAGVYSVQSSWRDKFQAEQKLRNDAKSANDLQVKGLQDAITRLDKDLKEFKGRTATAEAQVTTLRTQLATTRTSHDKTVQAYEVKVALQQAIQNDNNTKLLELQNLRTALAQLRAKLKSLTEQVAQLEDDKYGLQRKEVQIVKKYNEMLETLVAYRKTLQRNKISFDAAAVAGLDVLPDPADGLVSDVSLGTRDKATLVEITVGSDDGVTKGVQLHVFRLTGKPKYLGKIKIIQVSADTSIGEVVDDAKQGTIKKGDHVAAKLKY
jgi:chromosome segregation ATPase